MEGFGCTQCGEVMMLRDGRWAETTRKMSETKERTAVSVLPPLAMTLLDVMNWPGTSMWLGFADV